MFTLYEELQVLSIREGKVNIIESAINRLKPGLVGAILAELALRGKIQSTNNHRVQLVDDNPTEIEILNEILAALKESEKERKFGYWINNLNPKTDKFRKLITESLIDKKVLMREDDHLFWVIPSPLEEKIKASTKYWVNKRLRSIVLAAEETEVETRDIILLSLVKACGLLDLIFLRDERKPAERYINQQIFSYALKDPVMQTVQEIETAIGEIVEED